MKYKRRKSELLMRTATWAAAGVTGGVLLYLISFILIKGIPYIKPSLFAFTYTSDNVSLTPALVSTVIITALSLAIAVPLGVFAAIWLTEYAPRGSKMVAVIRVTAETLAGIPSIVYGLFGLLFFVTFLGWGFSVIAGAFTLSVMILPLILRSTEEALQSVPDTWREGAFGLGAGRLRTVFRVVLPAATPGISAGVILAIGRIVGETAALIYTAGTVAQIPENPMRSARTLSVHLYALSSEGLHTGEGYATAVTLLLIVILINAASVAISRRFGVIRQ
ncbi:MAG: phosphate ABC transporter permease PstA [Treponema sp.]|nr:phosphate ABC transporter permease PstA [Treponema sp.]